MKIKIFLLISLVLAFFLTTFSPTRAQTDNNLLRASQLLNVKFGTTASAGNMKFIPEYANLVKSNFNTITSDWEFHWGMDGNKPFRPSETTYDFEWTDSFVQFGIENNKAMEAHHLVWGYKPSLPQWLLTGNHSPQQLQQILQNHIETVTTRYKGKIAVWSVINEPFGFDWNGGSFWQEKLGPGTEWMDNAFRWADAADPNAILLLNDAGNEFPNLPPFPPERYDQVFNLAKNMKDRGVPIDGVGLQMHLNAKDFLGNNLATRANELKANIARHKAAGLEVYITEMDIRVDEISGTQEERFVTQAQIYKALTKAAVEAGVSSITTFGLTDEYSWYHDTAPTADATLFTNYTAKPAYEAIETGFSELHQKRMNLSKFLIANNGVGVHASAWSTESFSTQMDFVTNNSISAVRFPIQWDILQWDSTNKDYYNWDVYDSFVGSIPNKSVTLGVLGPGINWTGTPCSWDINLSCTTWNNLIPSVATKTRTSPVNGELWSDWEMYVYHTVKRYGSRGNNKIQAWEIMNEPDHPFEAAPFSDQELAARGQQYKQLLKASERIIKLADPSAIVVSAGLADFVEGSQPGNAILPRTKIFYENFLDTETATLIDGIGIHPYRGVQANLENNSLNLYLTDLNNYLKNQIGFQVLLWVTEVGFTSNSISNACDPFCQANSDNESTLMQQTLNQLKNSPVLAAFWYRISPQAHDDNGVHSAPYSLIGISSTSQVTTTPRTASFLQFNSQYINRKPGDANSDGKVNGVDYVIWLLHYKESSSGPSDGDFNSDGEVNGSDYVIWLQNYSIN